MQQEFFQSIQKYHLQNHGLSRIVNDKDSNNINGASLLGVDNSYDETITGDLVDDLMDNRIDNILCINCNIVCVGREAYEKHQCPTDS